MTSPSRISPLTDHVINQIAAGEVIERPLSIVKELVENSLDAGATSIDVRIESGGADLIAVRDNGRGIEAADLALALRRHCTSKLIAAEQLQQLNSLGFRGEALASIAAVSKLSLISRTAEAVHATEINCNYGELSGVRPAASYPVGTSVEVENLFAQTPARRKFLRQARTENLQISQLLKHIAFSHSDVSIVFQVDGKKVFNVAKATEAQTYQRRLRGLFGKEFAERALRLERSEQGLTVRGWVGPFDTHRPRADIQFLSVNGRVVKDRTLVHAIRLAYDGKIPEGRYPSYALDLHVPLTDVDVNVHPTKTEVRFVEPRRIHDQLYSFVTYALSTDPSLLGSSAVHAADPSHYETTSNQQANTAEVAESRYQSKSYSSSYSPRNSRSSRTLFDEQESAENNFSGVFFNRYALLNHVAEKSTDKEEGDAQSVGQKAGASPTFVDLFALLTELFQCRLLSDARSRPLIMPETVSTDLNNALGDYLSAYSEHGLVITRLGPENLILREVPLVMLPVNYAEFLSGLGAQANSTNDKVVDCIANAAARSVLVPADFHGQNRWFAQILKQLQSADINWHDFRVLRSDLQWQKFLGE